MYTPTQPLLAKIFWSNILIAFLAPGLAGRLAGRPEWLWIVFGMILLMGGLTNASIRYEKLAGKGYPVGPLWLMFGVVPSIACLLFWTGLMLSASGSGVPHTAPSMLCPVGNLVAGSGVALSIGLAVSPRKRVCTV